MNGQAAPPSGRRLARGLAILTGAVAVGYILNIPAWLGLLVFTEQYLVFLLYSSLILIFLDGASISPGGVVYAWISRLLVVACVVVAAIIIAMYPQWVKTSGYIEPFKLVVGALAVLLVLEGVRRQTGLFLVLCVVVGGVYALLAVYLPGPLQTLNTAWDRIILYLFFDNNSMLGLPLWVGATMALGFVMFGYALELSGAGDTLNRFAIRALGRFRGGPAYAAVLGSAQFGGFTGSVAADVYVSGTFTIPLMKLVGYRPPVAAAVEASASTGAGIMPPVMDPGAFLLAQTLGIPYPKVALSALLPALLYYSGIWISVHAETKHSPQVRRLGTSDFPKVAVADMVLGWSLLIISLGVLIFTVFVLYLDPALAALISLLPALVVVIVKKRLRGIFDLLDGTVTRLRDLIPVCAGAGLIIGILSLTGLGTSFSQWTVALSGNHPLGMISVVVLATLVLGLAMPPFVVYAVSALVLAPPLISIGAQPLAAHLFILYWSLFAQFTPPVCFAAMVAASIAKANPWTTAWHTMRIGFPAFIIPFLFLFSPALLLNGTFVEVVLVTLQSIIGLAAFIYGINEIFYGKGLRARFLGAAWLVLGFGVMVPFWIWNIVSASLLALSWFIERQRIRVQSA